MWSNCGILSLRGVVWSSSVPFCIITLHGRSFKKQGGYAGLEPGYSPCFSGYDSAAEEPGNGVNRVVLLCPSASGSFPVCFIIFMNPFGQNRTSISFLVEDIFIRSIGCLMYISVHRVPLLLRCIIVSTMRNRRICSRNSLIPVLESRRIRDICFFWLFQRICSWPPLYHYICILYICIANFSSNFFAFLNFF